MIDLAAEMVASMDDRDDRAIAWLRHQGVPEMALWEWPGPVGVVMIETDKMGTFAPSESGRRAFVHPVLVGAQFSELADLIAWFPDRPDRWWTRLRTGHPLGADQLEQAEFDDAPVMLRRTPLSWLTAGGDGVCVLDWRVSRRALRAVPIIIAEDEQHGREVKRRLTEPVPALPEIRILTQRAA